ncbi:MAG: MFS transporter [Saccharofermentans sp.]|nr:MFS transporter [Saccharofermentans sp.]
MSRLSEIKKLKERRSIAATIGYCFIIVLVVLYVMSNQLTGTYTVVLESERAETMQSLAVVTSAALGHTKINEGMTFPIAIPEYAKDKPYVYDIYTKAGNSFIRLYTSSGADTTEPYCLSGVGDEYNNCFELQDEAFTKRTEEGVQYVCAIAPIISQENTVAGILEVRMPYSDYSSTVNGMSLSWIMTIFAIAVAMAILVFELNLFVSTLSRGMVGNVPVLILYGDSAVRFLSFFAAFGSIMTPIIIADVIKDQFTEYEDYVVQLLIALGLIIYAAGFFGFSGLRKQIKFKLTGRIGLLVSVVAGYLLSLVTGITGSAVVMLILLLPTAFCYGMVFDSLRDYRINAGKLGYDKFDDRTIHNIQNTGYFLGVSVGAVIAGICYERFGMLIVYIICGAALILTSIGMIFFMKDNTPVKESYLPLNKWLELSTNKFTGRFMTSTFFVLGILVSFLLGFVPNYLATVGISLATSSFYYLVTAFSSCFIAAIIKGRTSHILTSKVRVIISSTCLCLGLLIFALIPTAKILLISVALIGISLGIHDFYYLYVLFLLANNRVKANLRKASEASFLAGMLIAVPVFVVALLVDIRIVFVISVIILSILAFIYPVSSFSNDVDDKDPTAHKAKKKDRKEKANAEQAQPQPQAPVAEQQMPDLYAVPEGYDEAYASYQAAMQMPVDDIYADPQQYIDNNVYPEQGGDYNGYVE